jgi:hypothetical protein
MKQMIHYLKNTKGKIITGGAMNLLIAMMPQQE